MHKAHAQKVCVVFLFPSCDLQHRCSVSERCRLAISIEDSRCLGGSALGIDETQVHSGKTCVSKLSAVSMFCLGQ